MRQYRNFLSLSEQEIIAMAIANEEEDSRLFADYAWGLTDKYPDSAKIFSGMAAEENEHRRTLIALYRERWGDHIPLIRRSDIRGAPVRKPSWQTLALGIDAVRSRAQQMEIDAARFYTSAAARVSDAKTRALLGDLAQAEMAHAQVADGFARTYLSDQTIRDENLEEKKNFIIKIVQPGLVGLMDGSVSTLAPVFAAAFATQNSHDAFLVGLAASIGAGISMGMAEGLSDDGRLSGRGAPLLRGLVCGFMTVLGGIGHTLPFLIQSFWPAITMAILAVIVELGLIAWIRWKWQETPPLSALWQVGLGGILVFCAGALIGSG